MISEHPIQALIIIVIGVAVLGFIIEYFRRSAHFRGFEELRPDATAVAQAMRAEVDRDGEDLLVRGNFQRWPVLVRFSYSDTMPGLNIQMKIPASLSLYVIPKGSRSNAGRTPVRTGDEMFDARVNVRTDHPAEARLFVSGKAVLQQLQRLSCSANTFISLSSGALEVTELTIPDIQTGRPTGRHVLDHIQSMAVIANSARAMPGAESIPVNPFEKEKSVAVRAALALSILVFVGLLVAAVVTKPASILATPQPAIPAGMLALDAGHIRDLDAWRLAEATDFAGPAVSWMRGQGFTPAGKITGNFSGASTAGQDNAYVLIGKDPAKTPGMRVVLLINHEIRSDTSYPAISVVTKVPKASLAGASWQGTAPAASDGDGLLVVRRADDPGSGVIFFSSGVRILYAAPKDFRSLSL